jgi:hypothetical protein
MAHMNDNWLLMEPKRNAGHIPIAIQIEVGPTESYLADEAAVVLLRLVRANKKYLPLYLSTTDIDGLVRQLWGFSGQDVRTELSSKLFSSLKDRSLLAALTTALVQRSESKESR